MLKKSAILLLFVITAAFFWKFVPIHPSIDTIAEIASIKVSRAARILVLERMSDGREPEFVVSLSVPEGGNNFCKNNNLTDNSLPFQPFSPGDKGYDLLLGKPGICYGIRKLGNGGVYIVVRSSEVVIYVDDR